MVAEAAARQPSKPPRTRADRIPTPSLVERARKERNEDAPYVTPPRATPVDASLHLLERHGLFLVAAAFAMAFLAGAFGRRGTLVGAVAGSLLGAAVIAAAVWRLTRVKSADRVAVRTDVALGLLALDGAFAIVQATGDKSSALYPLVYLLGAYFAVAPLPRSAGLGLVAAALGLNALRYACTDSLGSEWHSLVVQACFTTVFAFLYHVILSARLAVVKVSEQQAVAARLNEAEESARSLRLIVADRSRDRRELGDEAEISRRLVLGAVLEVERSVASIVATAQLALDAHAAALFRLDDSDQTLRLRDGRCASGLLRRDPMASGDGLCGEVLRSGRAVRKTGRISGIHWYDRSVGVQSVLIVPVVERAVDGTGYVRGVFVADRLSPEPFSEKEEQLLVEMATQAARAVEAERLVGELHRAKDAQDRFQRAAEELNKLSTVDEVARAATKLAIDIIPSVEFSALTRTVSEDGNRTHVVVAAEGTRAAECDGLVFDDNDGLVAHVVRLGGPLPARAPGVLERVKIFDEKMAGFGSLRILPLTSQGKVLGTLVAGTKARGAMEDEAKRRLDTFSTLVAGALSRALALGDVERLATTDGLTGLTNRRQLEALSNRAFLEATRYGRPLAALVTDVDHFKKVNDTYGHAAGDEVLKRVAKVLMKAARGTDVVGRYGGEEFVLVCPNTDADGARDLAERIRRDLEGSTIETSAGPIKVTMSIGVAAYPHHGTTLESLVHAGDEALYVAKKGGRNRVVVAGVEAAQATQATP